MQIYRSRRQPVNNQNSYKAGAGGVYYSPQGKMLEEKVKALVREIMSQWSSAEPSEPAPVQLPSFLRDPLLADLIGAQSDVVVQVLDLRGFKSVYVSPNVHEVCGFSPEEINSHGIKQWLSNVPVSEIPFQLKNAYLVAKMRRELPPRAQFRSALINGSLKTKSGERRRILAQSSTIDWGQEGSPRHLLFLWKDASRTFTTNQVVVRHEWRVPAEPPIIWTYNPLQGRFAKRELFSEREREILSYVEQGFVSKEIAERLQISAFTVENHRKNIIRRLSVCDTGALIDVCKWLKIV